MDNEIIEAYRPLYNRILEKPLAILALFEAQFGEENVELQGVKSLAEFAAYCQAHYPNVEPSVLDISNRDTAIKKRWRGMPDDNICIIVHFPEVRVSNENNRYVDITHLWARVTVTLEGTTCGRFTMVRSEFPESHWISDYAHSHLSGIHDSFQSPCTGSGPINGTITTCSTSYQEDFWRLYCYELSLFVKVESLAGRPYRKLENIITDGTTTTRIEMREEDATVNLITGNPFDVSQHRMLKDFMRYLIGRRKLRFNLCDGSYGLGMSPKDFRIFLSNEFITWFNLPENPWKVTQNLQELFDIGFLNYVKFNNGKILRRVVRTSSSRGSSRNIQEYNGRNLFEFKGQPVILNIISNSGADNEDSSMNDLVTENYSILLNKDIALQFRTIILRLLNGKYGENRATITRVSSQGGFTQTTTARDVLFL